LIRLRSPSRKSASRGAVVDQHHSRAADHRAGYNFWSAISDRRHVVTNGLKLIKTCRRHQVYGEERGVPARQ
jgi:hypothetical protein